RRAALRSQRRDAESRHDESTCRVPAEERRAVQRERRAHGVLGCLQAPERRGMADDYDAGRGSTISARAPTYRDSVQKRTEWCQMGSKPVFRAMVARLAVAAAAVVLAAVPMLAEVDFTGTWAKKSQNDNGNAREQVDFLGMPLSADGRAKALSYNIASLS